MLQNFVFVRHQDEVLYPMYLNLFWNGCGGVCVLMEILNKFSMPLSMP